MTPSDRPHPSGRHPQSGLPGARPSVQEETLRTERIQIERKAFVLSLKENPRGRFLRITEDVGGRRDAIIIPATGLEEFRRVVDEMVKTSTNAPSVGP